MKKKGISLIVLVITIIVIVILATAVIVTVVQNNPIQKAKEAVSEWGKKMTIEEMVAKEAIGLLEAMDNRWDGSIDTSFKEGKGTSSNPYIIKTPSELAYLASQVNAGNSFENTFFHITKSMDLSGIDWEPIGCGSTMSSDNPEFVLGNKFSGNIDGLGNTISGINIYKPDNYGVGLIGIMEGGSVKNIIVKGSVKAAGITSGVVGEARQSNISSCINRVNVMAVDDGSEESNYRGNEAGGIAGKILDNTVIEKCINYGEIKGSNYYNFGETNAYISTGGIVAFGKDSQILSCVNNGKVRSTTEIVGGIAGRLGNSKIIDSKNTAEVTTLESVPEETQLTKGNFVGGVAGNISALSLISSCSNSGNVSGMTDVGGIIGYSSKSGITDSINSGKIISKYVDEMSGGNGGEKCGGIAGRILLDSYISNCSNSGDVIADFTDAAGIVSSFTRSKVSNCINTGKVTIVSSEGVDTRVGGIGCIGSNASIVNSSNLGDINILGEESFGEYLDFNVYAGGIVSTNSSNTTIESCYNSGNITSVSPYAKINILGGIVGVQETKSLGIKDSYNKGILNGTTVGGVVGQNIVADGITSPISSCYYFANGNEKGIGSQSEDVSVIVAIDDVSGKTEKTADKFMNIDEFLKWLNK